MSQFKVIVTKMDGHPSGEGGVIETEVFRQVVDDLELGKFVQALNKKPRARKAKVAKV